MEKKEVIHISLIIAIIISLFFLTTYLNYSGAITKGKTEYGKLEIVSNVEEGKVYMDGVYVGETTLKLDNVAPGWHLIEIKKSGYSNYYTHVNIRGSSVAGYKEGTTPVVRIKARMLKLYPADIQLSSEPGGANVYLDNVFVGVTPLNGKLILSNIMPGHHEIIVGMVGHNTQKIKISHPNGKISSKNFILEPTGI